MSGRATRRGAQGRTAGGAFALAIAAVLASTISACGDEQLRRVEEQFQVVGGQPHVDPSLPTVDRAGSAAKPTDFGSSSPVQVDAFVQKTVAKVDILWVIDNSGSMKPKQDKVKANFQAFIAKLVENNQSIDYHIGVVTTDTMNPGESGKLQNKAALAKPWVGRDTCGAGCDPVAAFRANSSVGIQGSGDEKGLLAAMMALSAPLTATNGANHGFLRDDAALFIIMLSDEEDSSCSPGIDGHGGGCNTPLTYGAPDFYARFFEGLKGFGRKEFATVGAIVALGADASIPNVNPPRKGCQMSNPPAGSQPEFTYAVWAPRYVEVARMTGGLATSICDSDYLPALQNLGFLATGAKTTFLLTRAPYAQDIKVYVTKAGEATRTLQVPGRDYNYRPCTGANDATVFNAIEFSLSSIPPASATIEVEYPVNVRGVTCP